MSLSTASHEASWCLLLGSPGTPLALSLSVSLLPLTRVRGASCWDPQELLSLLSALSLSLLSLSLSLSLSLASSLASSLTHSLLFFTFSLCLSCALLSHEQTPELQTLLSISSVGSAFRSASNSTNMSAPLSPILVSCFSRACFSRSRENSRKNPDFDDRSK